MDKSPTAEYRYTPFYCEENIWHLARQKFFQQDQSLVAIITGRGNFRRLWHQSQCENPQLPVYWDYHVILLSFDQQWWVWDLDTSLGLPVTAEQYFPQTFLGSGVNLSNCDVVLRLLECHQYLEDFSSDRAHMKSPSGEWLAAPPSWPLIYNGDRSNLSEWRNIDHEKPGKLVSLAAFMREYLEAG